MLEIRWLGKVAYHDAYALQRRLFDSDRSEHLLLLEHNHVYTLGVRADTLHVLVDPKTVGAEMVQVNRGGDVTYHGPGQLVGYPILNVPAVANATPDFVARLEDLLIETLDRFEIVAERNPGYPGVWTRSNSGELRKIAAIGVRISKQRSMHGFALNVRPDMSMFSNIVPCGIADFDVTSMELEGSTAVVEDVVAVLAEVSARVFSREATSFFGVSSANGYLSATDVDWRQNPQVVKMGVSRLEGEHRSLDRRLANAGVLKEATIAIGAKKPDWVKLRSYMGDEYQDLKRTMRSLNLVTVCEEAGCPNIFECWSQGTATFMINGEDCTRACGFCLVRTDKPKAIDLTEAARVARAVKEMNLEFAVITAVARDDLADGGASGFVDSIAAIRQLCPGVGIEVLIPDCKGSESALAAIYDARPEVLNHNMETVLRLQRAVRPQASYARSLRVLCGAVDKGLIAKSGIIVGMGETINELHATLRDLAAIGVEIVTIGQYLRPTRKHLAVSKWYTPREFTDLKAYGESLGIRHIESAPNARSSYHAKRATDGLVVLG